MTLDEDQGNWNKENTPLNDDKAMYLQISQNFMHEGRQEVTRQVLAELKIKSLDEDDESDESGEGEDNKWQQNSDTNNPSSFPSQRSGYFWQVFRFSLQNVFCDLQTNDEAVNNESRKEQTKMVILDESSADNISSKGEESVKYFCSDEDWKFDEETSPQSIRSKWKVLQQYRRSTRSSEFYENQETAINRDNEDLEEFITPPLCAIPGVELENKSEEHNPQITLPKTSLSSGLSHEIQSKQFLG
ncbi:unnamed protein product [Litomosoides sigmodontis]|uniref:Uncharacterized protein n=1 Tax=Litomosoides sigmodontis TaxID=42156 RepID=A0A3P6TUK4_LITSI|nr:unnamed protein product [Litomosoides sigmodontis]